MMKVIASNCGECVHNPVCKDRIQFNGVIQGIARVDTGQAPPISMKLDCKHFIHKKFVAGTRENTGLDVIG